MNANPLRIGNFTSSEIYRLMTNAKDGSLGKPALSYIEEKNMERRLGRSLNNDTNSKPTSWGKLVERRVFELLSTDYRLCSTDTIQHSEIDFWTGSPDCEKFDEGKTCPEIKCPMTLLSFCQLIDPSPKGGFCGIEHGLKVMETIREDHKDGDKYWWQIISNSILLNAKFGELIVYVPYKSELDELRDMAANWDGDQNKISWLGWANDSDLPYLLDGGLYKNLNVIRFTIPEEDKKLLTSRILEAGKLLIPKLQLATA